MALDIHDFERQLRGAFAALDRCSISDRNKDVIRSIVREQSLRGVTVPRQVKYVDWLRRIAGVLGKDFEDATVEDIKGLIWTYEQRRKYSVWTRKDLRIMIKKLYAFLRQCPVGTYPPEVSWISTGHNKREVKLPGDGNLLTPDDVQKLIASATNLRDRALVSMLWESGCRIGELGNLQLKHVVFDQHGALLSVRGKTGARQVRLISSVPFLANWMSCHPHGQDSEAPLWALLTRKRVGSLDYGYFRMFLQRLAARAGISKRVYPHLFRHSRATLLANHLTEFQMNHYFGWTQGSSMPSTYVHLSGRNIDDSLLALNGLPGTREGLTQSDGVQCLSCSSLNPRDAPCCRRCGVRRGERPSLRAQPGAQGESGSSQDQARALIGALLANPDLVAELQSRLGIKVQEDPVPVPISVSLDAPVCATL